MIETPLTSAASEQAVYKAVDEKRNIIADTTQISDDYQSVVSTPTVERTERGELRIEDGIAPARKSRRRMWMVMSAIAAILAVALIVTLVIKLRARSHAVAYDTDDDASRRPPEQVLTDPTYTHQLNIPPRLQWNENYGYCGSTSMICAGLYFGAYISQYDNRRIASNSTNQKEESSQLLLGVND
jgi:hypothetical protein